MEDVVVRSRYPRRNVHSRRKKRNIKENDGLLDRIARQTVISLMILITIGIIKGANTPVTKYIVEKLKWGLTQNIDLQNIYKAAEDVVSGLTNNSPFDKEKKVVKEPEGEAIPVTAGVYTPEAGDSESVNSDQVAPIQKQETTQKSMRGEDAGTKASTAASKVEPADPEVLKMAFIAPVEGVVGEAYGQRIHPIKKTPEFHKGIDIEANKGASIKAAQAGEVIEAGIEQTYGNYMKIKHSDGFTTLYAHCSALIAKKGKKVKQGEVIAKVGDTGLSIGAHLHFELWKNGKTVDPMKYIASGLRLE